MRGEIVQKILKCLTQSEREGFLARVALLPEGEAYAKICKYLLENKTYSDTGLMDDTGLNRYQKNARLDEIGKLLLTTHSIEDPLVTLSTLFVMAKRLRGNMEYPTSIIVVNEGIQVAEQSDRHEWVVEFLDLLDDFPEDLPELAQVKGMTRAEARRHLGDVYQLDNLIHDIPQARREPTAEGRKDRLEEIMKSAQEIGASETLCNKAKWKYLKIMAFCHVLLSQPREAMPYQEALVKHLETYPDSCLEPDYTRAKEMRSLSLIYQSIKLLERYRQTMGRMNAIDANNLHSEFQKTNVRFPFAITMPLDEGNVEEGNQACADLLEVLDNPAYSFSKQFQTENLYCAAYFYFASNNTKALINVLRKLNRYIKADFKPRGYIYYKMFGLVRALDDCDWEDAIQKLRYLRNPRYNEEVPGLEHALDFLEDLAASHCSQFKEENHADLKSSLEVLSTKLKGLELLSYIDIVAWVRSKMLRCPLIEIFNQRANQSD